MPLSRHNARHNPRFALKRKNIRPLVRSCTRSQERFVIREVTPGPSLASLVRDFNAAFKTLLKIRWQNANPPGLRRFKRLLTDEEADKKFREDLERVYGQGRFDSDF